MRYEMRGSGSFGALASVDAALDFHNRLTPAAVEARDRYLAARTRVGLRAIAGVELFSSDDPQLGCGLVSFRLRTVEPKRLAELLWERHQIYIRNVTHPEIDWDANRASLHLMATASQVDGLVGAVAEIAKETRA